MIDRKTAERMVHELINGGHTSNSDERIIIDDATIEKPYGWVFFYNSRRFLETEDFSYYLVGQGPVIVEKVDGSIHEFGSAQHPDVYIAEYEAGRSAG
ncbi:MAG TPA: YrhB domain-containing protein [Herpetosiphonaceae bacterium]